ncbi:MAG: hypothetical protein Hens2KO_27890 [Henriciella sp.]
MNDHVDNLPLGYILQEFEILEQLGRGGFGITYKARDLNLKTDVAIKEFLPGELARRASNNSVQLNSSSFSGDYDKHLKNFKNEAEILARFEHPNIVRVRKLIKDYNNTSYYVMDLVRGPSLTELISGRGELSVDAARLLMEKLLDGLELIHRRGLIHRDIKPSNILVAELEEPAHSRLHGLSDELRRQFGRPVFIDFGTARTYGPSAASKHTSFKSHGYTPLEQDSGRGQDERSDIYSLAAVMYACLTGEMPIDAGERAAGVKDPLVPLSAKFEGHEHAAFLSAIDRGMALKSDGRPKSVKVWRRELFGLGSSERQIRPVLRPTSDVDDSVEPQEGLVGNRRLIAVAAIALLLLIMAAIALITIQSGPKQLAFWKSNQDQQEAEYHASDTPFDLTATSRIAVSNLDWSTLPLEGQGAFLLEADAPFRVRAGGDVYTVSGEGAVDIDYIAADTVSIKGIYGDVEVRLSWKNAS